MIEERLLASLKRHATARGMVLLREEVLLREVGATREDAVLALDKCERAGLVTILSPFPFLVLRLRSWSGMTTKPRDSRPTGYSYSLLSNNRLNESHRRSGDDALLREILNTLGVTDSTTFEGAVRNFPPEVIRKALDRVRRTRSLRKNRTALFRYLLTKLS
jgi:hypothetical protein